MNSHWWHLAAPLFKLGGTVIFFKYLTCLSYTQLFIAWTFSLLSEPQIRNSLFKYYIIYMVLSLPKSNYAF